MSEERKGPAEQALVLGDEIKKIVAGSPLEKDAMLLGAMYQSGYFKDTQSLSQAITKALIGQQMGMGLVASMNSLYVIDGKVAMDSHAIRNTAVMAGYSILTKQLDDTKCVLEWSFEGKVLGESEFTWTDATKAGLTSKSNWQKYPKDMLFARAMTRGARMYANQAFANQAVYERDEIQDNGEFLDISPIDERADRIRNAKSIDELNKITEALNADEQRTLTREIQRKIEELDEANNSSSSAKKS